MGSGETASPLWYLLATGCILLYTSLASNEWSGVQTNDHASAGKRFITGAGIGRAAPPRERSPPGGGGAPKTAQRAGCSSKNEPPDDRDDDPGRTTVLVTGAAGLLGLHVARLCVAKGLRVVAVDVATSGVPNNAWERLPASALAVPGDLTDAHFVRRLFATYTFTHVYHLGAQRGATEAPHLRAYTYRRNLVASAELLNAAVKHKVGCFVFGSSASVYGRSAAGGTAASEEAPLQPANPHSISLYAFEMDLRAAHRKFGIDYVIFRSHDVYGPWQSASDPANLVAAYIGQGVLGAKMAIAGDGTEKRGFSYVDDVAAPIAQAPFIPGARNQVFNVGSDQLETVNGLVQQILGALNRATRFEDAVERDTHKAAHRSGGTILCSHEKIRKTFKLPTATTLKHGIQKTVAVMNQHHPTAALYELQQYSRAEIARQAPARLVNGTLATAANDLRVAAGQPPSLRAEPMGRPAVVVSNSLPSTCAGDEKAAKSSRIIVPKSAVRSYREEVSRQFGAFANSEQPLKWRQPGDGKKERPKTLLSIHTAVSYWGITEKMIMALAVNKDEFDVILVDDHSKRVDVEALAEALGVKVLKHTASKPKGNTYTWNLAWKYFLENPCYEFLIVCNNDLLVPTGTVQKLSRSLAAGWAWLLPMTSHRGTTYNWHRLMDYYSVETPTGCLKRVKGRGLSCDADWTDQPMNFQRVQDSLDQSMPNYAGNMIKSPVGNLNGYMMAFNKELLRPHQASNQHLFDPSLKNTNNEDLLSTVMSKNGESRKGVHTGAFVFHYKGYTLYSAHHAFAGMGRDVLGEKNYGKETI